MPRCRRPAFIIFRCIHSLHRAVVQLRLDEDVVLIDWGGAPDRRIILEVAFQIGDIDRDADLPRVPDRLRRAIPVRSPFLFFTPSASVLVDLSLVELRSELEITPKLLLREKLSVLDNMIVEGLHSVPFLLAFLVQKRVCQPLPLDLFELIHVFLMPLRVLQLFLVEKIAIAVD